MNLPKTQNPKALLFSTAVLFAVALFAFACGFVPAQTAHAAEATATTLTSGTRADGQATSAVHATAKSKSKSKRKMSKARVTGATPQFTTSLKRVKLPSLKVRWKGKTLRKGRDYSVKYKNNKYPDEAFPGGRSFAAYQDYDSTNSLDSVQDVLCQQIIETLVEDIFNATVAEWR